MAENSADWLNTPFVTSDYRVRWGDVGTAAASFVLVEVFGSIADLVAAIFEVLIRPVNALSTLLGSGVSRLFEIPVRTSQATEILPTFGLGAFAISVVLVAIGGYLVALTVSEVL